MKKTAWAVFFVFFVLFLLLQDTRTPNALKFASGNPCDTKRSRRACAEPRKGYIIKPEHALSPARIKSVPPVYVYPRTIAPMVAMAIRKFSSIG